MTLGPLQKYPKRLLGSEHDPVAGSYESGNELTVPQHCQYVKMETAQCSRLIKKTTLKRWALVVHSYHTFLCAFITYYSVTFAQLLCNLAPLSCYAICHHSVVLQLVIQLVRNLWFGCCATCNH